MRLGKDFFNYIYYKSLKELILYKVKDEMASAY